MRMKWERREEEGEVCENTWRFASSQADRTKTKRSFGRHGDDSFNKDSASAQGDTSQKTASLRPEPKASSSTEVILIKALSL